MARPLFILAKSSEYKPLWISVRSTLSPARERVGGGGSLDKALSIQGNAGQLQKFYVIHIDGHNVLFMIHVEKGAWTTPFFRDFKGFTIICWAKRKR